MKNREAVVKLGEDIELKIETVNHDGEGVGRYKGLAVFVPFTVPGEEVVVRVTGLKKNFALGKVLETTVTAPSGNRVSPPCPVFSLCGGSKLQHIDYRMQLEIKRKLVEDSLKRIGRITDAVVHPVIGMDEPWGYRNKAVYQVNRVDGKVELGFFVERTHTHVPTIDCLLLDGQIRDIAPLIEGMLNKYGVPSYDWETGRGLLRHVVVRKGSDNSKIMIVFVTSAGEFAEQFTMAREIRAKAPQTASIVRNINTSPTRQIFGPESQLLAGQLAISEELGGLIFNVSPTSFFQVNSRQAEILYEKAVEFAGLTGRETVLDVYCGTGTAALFLARKAGRVFGFEVSKEAVADAAANAKANKIINVEFIAGKAEERLPKLLHQGMAPDVIVVDPPRQGMEKRALQAAADMGPDRIVYISCDPGTMARDLNFLSHRGYRTVEVQPVDMFPQTAHVECISLIERVKA